MIDYEGEDHSISCKIIVLKSVSYKNKLRSIFSLSFMRSSLLDQEFKLSKDSSILSTKLNLKKDYLEGNSISLENTITAKNQSLCLRFDYNKDKNKVGWGLKGRMMFENVNREKRREFKGIGKFDKIELEGNFRCLDSSKTIENYGRFFEKSYARITAFFDSNRVKNEDNKDLLKNSLCLKL